MSKGSGGARSATAPKTGTNSESMGKYNSTTGEGLAYKITEGNLTKSQELATKPGTKILSGWSGEFVDNKEGKYKVKPGDMIVPSSDKRPPPDIRGDRRPSSDFVPVNRGPISASSGKKGPTQSEIENAKNQFFQKERKLTQAREEIRKWEKWNDQKKINDIKKQVKETRTEVMALGKKIIDFDRKRGQSTDYEYVFSGLYSDLR